MSAADFLTGEELRGLTGFTLKSKQADWLRRHGWTHFIGADGRARVAREHYAVKMGFGAAPSAPQPGRIYRVNEDALRALAR